MSLIKSNTAGLGGSGSPGGALGSFYGDTIDQSLRFEDGDSPSLTFNPSSSGNRKTWTLSLWIKRSNLGEITGQEIPFFSAGTSATSWAIFFTADDVLFIQSRSSSSNQFVQKTNNLFRDVGAWYHIVYAFDTTQATDTNRSKLYVNGEQITLIAHSGNTLYPSQNTDYHVNNSSLTHYIGYGATHNEYLDGYLAEVNFIDGAQYDASYFGETKDGVWIPKAYSGSYGTNGFKFDFSDSNYIGRDKSGSKTLVTSTSFSTFGGGDTNFSSTEYAKAADNDLSTNCDRTGSGGIIEFTPSSAVTPTSHTMINASSSGYTTASRPNSVLLQGSNDNGGSWTTIDDLTNGSGANTITTSSFSNSTSYAKLRLNISENHGGSNTRFSQYIVFASDNNGDGENIFFRSNLVASDVVPDSPTNNFATMNPIYHSSRQATLSEGNLKVKNTTNFSNAGANGYGAVSTFAIPRDKKVYIEVQCDSHNGTYWYAGFATQSGLEAGVSSTNTGGASSVTFYNRAVMKNGTQFQYSSSSGVGGLGGGTSPFAIDDVLGMAVDGSNGNVWFSKNGSYFKTIASNNGSTGNVGDPSAGSDPVATVDNVPAEDLFVVIGTGNPATVFVNFGQDSTNVASANADSEGIGTFEYAVPTGYVSLCAANLTTPDIGPTQNSQADDHFDTKLYEATGSTLNITGINFQPDWIWAKRRDGIQEGRMTDSVRGVNAQLRPAATNAETTFTNAVTSFNSDGFTLGADSSNSFNYYTDSHVAWLWKAGGAPTADNSAGNGATPTAGSVKIDGSNLGSALAGSLAATRLSANTTAGFSIVIWDASGVSSGTMAHGLTAAPDLIIAKNRNHGTNWFVQVPDVLANTHALNLDTNGAAYNPGINHFDDTVPTATVFSFGGYLGGHSDVGGNTQMIAYCFHSVSGYSSVGSYIGNNSTDGPFVFTGFRPAFLFLKRTDNSASWLIYDSKRDTYNQMQYALFPDNANAEYTSNLLHVDFLSNGFKIRNDTYGETNVGTYMYWAIAEAPFKFANAR